MSKFSAWNLIQNGIDSCTAFVFFMTRGASVSPFTVNGTDQSPYLSIVLLIMPGHGCDAIGARQWKQRERHLYQDGLGTHPNRCGAEPQRSCEAAGEH